MSEYDQNKRLCYEVFEKLVEIDEWDIPKEGYGGFGGCIGGLVRCKTCGKEYSWFDWGAYRTQAGTWMIKHLIKKHEVSFGVDNCKSIDTVYAKHFMREWLRNEVVWPSDKEDN